MAVAEVLGTRDTTHDFLRSFSIVGDNIEDDDDFDVLSPIPDTAESPDAIDGSIRRFPNKGDNPVLPYIPFADVQKNLQAFSTQRENCWIPYLPIICRITAHEKHTAKIMNPYLYTIEVEHGDFKWTIKRRYKHFKQLHTALTLYRARIQLPIPKKAYVERRRTMKRDKQVSVRFPRNPDYLISESHIEEKKEQLEGYLCSLLKCKSYRNHNETMKFFEVSPISFGNKLGRKGKEGLIKKCSGGRKINIGCCGCLRNFHFAGTWNRRWLVIKDSFVAYVRPEDGAVSDVMLMDSEFEVECGMAMTGTAHGILISNLTRKLLIKCWTSRKAREWTECLQDRAKSTAIDYTAINRFQSYAPSREDSYARWFVDAAYYFEAVADALEKAKEEIYITDWWLSPEIYMKRPMTDGDKWRLDVILKRKAEEGVKIYVLLYKEVELALGIKSRYSKHILMTRHPNIKVLRHPDHGANGVLLWAHHEKLVVIDQVVAFLGGIDLCYGRWDNEKHKLKDLGSVDLQTQRPATSISTISAHPEESAVTDTTEVTEELGSSDKLSLPSLSKVYGVTEVSPADISIHVSPPTPRHTPDPDTDHVTLTDQSEAAVFEQPDTPMGSNSQRSTSLDKSDIPQNNKSSVSVSGNQSGSVEQTDQSEHVTESGVDHVDGVTVSVNPVLESQMNRKNSEETNNGVHSWKETADKKNLKLIIPNKNRKLTKTKAIEDEDLIVPEKAPGLSLEPRHSAGSDASQTSQSGLISTTSTNLTTPKSRGGRRPESDVPDMATAAVRLKAFRGLIGRDRGEQNNNRGDASPVSPGMTARRRWKMVFNVQKFESGIKQNQNSEPESVPREFFMGDEKSKRRHFRMGRQRDRSGSFDIGRELPPDIKRTKSEQDIAEQGLKGSSKLWIGKDYVNFIYKDFVELEAPYTDFIDRNTTPRMPWHDIGAVVYGKAARDVARHFIARWNFTKLAKCKKNNSYPLLLPKDTVKCFIPQSIKNITINVKTQILRSTSGWSSGIGATECSIHEAYIHCIENAKYYIYVENQFFITQVSENQTDVFNGIGNALYKRILRAHRAGELFRVYVVMPLLPAFEGEFGQPGGTALQAVTHWNYSSICRGGNSLIEKLSKEVPDANKYIVFCGLRTHDELNGKLVTELVYVHSKLLIVDDDTVIIGSANINDRSMLGKRDSEMAVMVEDLPHNKMEVTLGGRPHLAGKFGASLRRTLFKEHLGLDDSSNDLDDIVSDAFYKNVWMTTVGVNTTVYGKVFNCLPANHVYTFADLEREKAERPLSDTNPDEAREELKKIKGFLVLIPLNFLRNENLSPRVGTKEAIMPTALWT